MLGHPPRRTVLIVDDVADIRAGYRQLLEHDGYRVLEAWNAKEALTLLEKEKVDVMLSDLYMPGDLDGIGLIRHLRDHLPKPHPAIIAMSGSPHLAYRSSLQSARYIGADAALAKPMTGDQLLTTIRGLTGGGQVAAT